MKKRIILLGMTLSLFIVHSKAQTFDEWFFQKKTQIKYLVEQIATLQIYTDYLEKGYDIAKNGLNLISDIKRGDFNLHNDHFNALKKVNPSVKNFSRIADIIMIQAEMLKAYQSMSTSFSPNGQFTTQEIAALRDFFAAIIDDIENDVDLLIHIITDGDLSMKDNERLSMITALYDSILEKYQTFNKQAAEIKLYLNQKKSDFDETQLLKKLYLP